MSFDNLGKYPFSNFSLVLDICPVSPILKQGGYFLDMPLTRLYVVNNVLDASFFQ